MPVNAPYFRGADLLVAADCSAYAYANFHSGFMAGKVTLIGCPKLDEGDYSEKLTAILRSNEIRSVTVTRMEVPCCGGLERAVRTALANARKRHTAGGRDLHSGRQYSLPESITFSPVCLSADRGIFSL